ncbi:chitinase [Xylogone sp. PMI_703]|nr:chitinase [Xylogone sp. PMI_703]
MRTLLRTGLLAHTILLLGFLSSFTLAQSTPQDPDYTCSADKPCAVGCCDKFGICGMGPEFCSPENCVGSCDAKSECDPAGWGPTYALSEGCPLNVCCSSFGFCGTTEEFCGDAVVPNPSCSGNTIKRNIGYYEGWSVTRACDVMEPESILASGYTHLNFAFASIDPNTFEVVPASTTDVALYSRLTGLKRLYPSLQVWISIGGWSMNDPDQPTATTFSDLARSSSAQDAFTNSLVSFMSTYGFDGVDIDWEYPVAPERSGRPEDLTNYPTLLSNIRSAFGSAGHNWGLSITLPSSFWYLQNFDIVKLEPLVDWFNMMEYDLHGTWDSTDVWIGAFVNAHTNLTEIDESLKLLWRNNISPDKVVLGLGFYGRSFALADPSCTAPGCPFSGAATAGRCTASAGTLSYSEIVNTVIPQGAAVTLDVDAAVKIVTWDGNWVSYDDADTLQLKIDYANSVCLGGTMVWAVSLDDQAGTRHLHWQQYYTSQQRLTRQPSVHRLMRVY